MTITQCVCASTTPLTRDKFFFFYVTLLQVLMIGLTDLLLMDNVEILKKDLKVRVY